MSFRTLLHLRPVALQPGRLLKHLTPTAANATVPSSTAAPYKLLLPRISYSSAHASPMLQPLRNFLGTGHGSFSAVKMKGPEKKAGEDTVVTAGGDDHGRQATKGSRFVVQRSKFNAYEYFGEMYVLVYVLSWVLGRFTYLAVRDGLRRLRRYVREKVNQKR